MSVRLGLVAIVVLALGSGCHDEHYCEPKCPFWELCTDGVCVLKPGHCRTAEDCPASHPICEDHACVEDPDGPVCGPCEEWEVCNESYECVPRPGRCNDDSDCPIECDLSTNTCISNQCDPPCFEWQECIDNACEPAPGRCADSGDCPEEAPICHLPTNSCRAESGPHEPESWPGVIITSDALAESFEPLAALHTLTGAPTRIVTVEEICAASYCSEDDTRRDAPYRIKEWLTEQAGLRYVLLGGGIEHVPARWVSAEFSVSAPLSYHFEEEFVTDFYYSDLSEWDKNDNGVYAEPEDLPEPGEVGVLDYSADLAVARLPVSTPEEAARYAQRVLDYLEHKDLTRLRHTLLLSNVATEVRILGMDIEIDGGWYFDMEDRTIDVFPDHTHFVKLYALGRTDVSPDAVPLTVQRQLEEMEAGHNLIVHSGHGSEQFLTGDEDGSNAVSAEDVHQLENTQYPIMLSSACSAGNFALGGTAGEKVMTAPGGGVIGYLGNTATGLGLAGGMQLIDELIRHAFENPNSRVGDSLVNAHHSFEYPDYLNFDTGWPTLDSALNGTPIVDRDSWEWTKKSTVYFGDPMIPWVTNPYTLAPPSVEISRTEIDHMVLLEISVSPVVNGTLMIEAGGDLYRIEWGAGADDKLILPSAPERVRFGFVSDGAMPLYGEQAFDS